MRKREYRCSTEVSEKRKIVNGTRCPGYEMSHDSVSTHETPTVRAA